MQSDMLVEDIDAFYSLLSSNTTVQPDAETFPASSVHNLVGTAMVEKRFRILDLRTISRLLPNCVYDQQKFAAITIRIHRPSCTVLLFTSGKMVLTGCRSYIQCVLAAHEVVRLLRSASPGYFFRLRNVKIQNIVGNVDLNLDNRVVDLERFHADHSIFSTYQRNMFPGLIYRPDHSPVVLLIFSSGKIVITGGKSVYDVSDGWKALWPTVQKYVCLREELGRPALSAEAP
jgi:transcription initiation factor TFIID TATA-box-binding protein